jgi:hypothetical protein
MICYGLSLHASHKISVWKEDGEYEYSANDVPHDQAKPNEKTTDLW